jgi:hypothetical protein
MPALLTFAKIFLLLVSLLGVFIYAARRRNDRHAFHVLGKSPVIRSLNEAEFAALEPFRLTGQLDESREVRRLTGPYVLEGDGGQTLHERLGEVEVLLPYDARRFVAEHNPAEVVLGRSQAIVVRMHGFDIVAGRAREQAVHAQRVGDQRNAHRHLPADGCADGATASLTHSTDGASAYLLGQRVETPEERALRQRPWLGWSSAGCYLLACLLFWLGTLHNLGLAGLMLVAGLISAVVGVLLTRPRKRPLPTAGTVNMAQGILEGPRRLPNGHVDTDSPVLVIGGIDVYTPRPWCSHPALPVGQRVLAHFRAEDRHLLSLSCGALQAQTYRWPPVNWGRHLCWTGTAILATLWSLHAGNGVLDDLDRASLARHVPVLRSDATPATLLAAPPQPGDRVDLRGMGTCGAAPLQVAGHTLAQSDCRQTLWGGPAIVAPAIALPEPLALLDRDQVMSVQLTPETLDALLSPLPSASAASNRTRVNGVATLVETLDLACREGIAGCDALRRRVLEALLVAPKGSVVDSGEVLRARLADEIRQDPQMQQDVLYLTKPSIKALYEIQVDLVRAFTHKTLADISTGVLAPPGGLVLIDTHAPMARRPAILDAPLEDWQQTRDQVSLPQPFTISGWVTGFEHDASGLRLHIDTGASSSPFVIALVCSIWRVLALLLLIVQCFLLWRCWRKVQLQQASVATALGTPAAPRVDD